MSMTARKKTNSIGFTMVEVVVCIIIVGILFGISIIIYTNVIKNTGISAAKADLENASKQIKVYKTMNSSYPSSISDCPTPAAGNLCLKPSGGNTFSYQANNTSINKTYRLTVSSSSKTINFSANENNLFCPLNFIVVPGSTTYGTNDFCAMKYEARDGGNNIPVSQANGTPWVNITQTNAIAYSKNVVDCGGCHLITEAEWLTIAQNVLSVASNWTDAAGTTHIVGTGYIYSGHNDHVPDTAITANTDDTKGYDGTGNYAGDSSITNNMAGNTQRRTLTLTNGEVIWDIAGNVQEWTNATLDSGQQPGRLDQTGYDWTQWNDSALTLNGLSEAAKPAYTGIAGSSSWDTSYGVGRLYSYYGEATGAHSYVRGGRWANDTVAGVMTLSFGVGPSATANYLGFRVAW